MVETKLHADETSAYRMPALAVLSEISASLATESDVEALVQRFLGTMMRLAGARAGAVWLLSENEQHLRLIGSLGLPQELVEREREVSLPCGICSEAALKNTVRATADSHFCALRTGSAFFDTECRRIVAVPLQYKGRVLGSYSFFLDADRAIPDEVTRLFRAISEQLGLALETARLTRANMRAALMNERQLLANEVHDSLAQTLAYMKMRMPVLREAVASGDRAQSLRYIDELGDALDTAYSGVRELLAQFRNRMHPHGLLQALQQLVQHHRLKNGLEGEFQNHAGELDLSPEDEVQVFHIVQEALANVVKHARARRVAVRVERENGRHRVTVTDDGVGLQGSQEAAESRHGHFGIDIMRERAARLGGTLDIEATAGCGTRVELVFAPRQAGGAMP